MSKLDDILISQHTDPNYANWDTIIEHDKQQIKDLMLITYHKAVLQDGDTTDNFIKEVESL